jgi:hypothetical protein
MPGDGADPVCPVELRLGWSHGQALKPDAYLLAREGEGGR